MVSCVPCKMCIRTSSARSGLLRILCFRKFSVCIWRKCNKYEFRKLKIGEHASQHVIVLVADKCLYRDKKGADGQSKIILRNYFLYIMFTKLLNFILHVIALYNKTSNQVVSENCKCNIQNFKCGLTVQILEVSLSLERTQWCNWYNNIVVIFP